MNIEKLIDTFCTKKRKKEGKTIYEGYTYNYTNFDRYLSDDFKPIVEAFNGYREIYFSKKQLCSVTTVEGDIYITLYDNQQAYEDDYSHTVEFYKDS